LDGRRFDLDNLSASRQPLPIPATKAEFIKPQGSNAPSNLFSTSMVAPRVKSGDRIVGSATVNITNGNIVYPAGPNPIEDFASGLLNSTPNEARVPITDSVGTPAILFPSEPNQKDVLVGSPAQAYSRYWFLVP
jgi:hypothetical protein